MHAVETAERWGLPTDDDEPVVIRLVTVPWFSATELESFRSRGEDDSEGSSDREDIIALSPCPHVPGRLVPPACRGAVA